MRPDVRRGVEDLRARPRGELAQRDSVGEILRAVVSRRNDVRMTIDEAEAHASNLAEGVFAAHESPVADPSRKSSWPAERAGLCEGSATPRVDTAGAPGQPSAIRGGRGTRAAARARG